MEHLYIEIKYNKNHILVLFLHITFFITFITLDINLFFLVLGTEDVPHRSVVNKVAQQLQKSLTEKGFALVVNHGIQEEKVRTIFFLNKN